ncbi:SH3-like domain-containing protein [Cognatiyoonia sediminum]|uniref:SH3-like domain-containing protein n=1 Tax=Cognatiyoonia sediminum TaxID=1508389 RepID=A0A1M5NHJ7_9RHOB|nr:SH3 domain-containing protein [Cognatiyoonia sediminum]SHG88915.1 SH3-like domain-containing protein [Cognatiyoonia sediminum]
MRANWRRLLWLGVAMCLAHAVSAQEVSQASNAPAPAPALGPETNLPLPRYVSLKANESNVRRGPSLSHRIDWVFQRKSMPLQVVAEYGHWRRVIDRDGLGGWVHYTMLSGVRTVIIEEQIGLLRRPETEALETAILEAGVIARLGECDTDWCRLTAGGYRGWAQKAQLWGVLPDEVRE